MKISKKKIIMKLDGKEFEGKTFTKKELKRFYRLAQLEYIINLPKQGIRALFYFPGIAIETVAEGIEWVAGLFYAVDNKLRWKKDILLVDKEKRKIYLDAIKYYGTYKIQKEDIKNN